MKTLLFTLEYEPFKGGVANYYKNLVINWPEPDNISVLYKNYLGRRLKHLFYLRDLYREYRRSKFDYILVGQLMPLGSVVYLFAKIFKVKYAVFIHGMEISPYLAGGKKAALVQKILRQADKIITPNNFTAELIKKVLINNLEKIVVVSPGISGRPEVNKARVAQLKEQYGVDGKKVVLSLGRLVKRKGFDTVLESLETMTLAELEKVMYVVAGAGPDSYYMQSLFLKYPRLKEHVLFLSEISDDDKWSWLDLCDIFVMPARNIAGDFEGFGIVYLEANLSHKAVIAGRAGGVPDAVVDGLNGILVDPENREELKVKILELLSDVKLRHELAERGYERVIKDFKWSDKITQIYKAVNFK
ncbi:MAG: glycosyltransferase family 4 protein [Candidatus Falkowbacteria bacterium]